MRNPWLDVPLGDYEGHMVLPGIEQAQLLSDIFSGVLEQYSPKSVAVLGCAGGNGFERIPSNISRVVGVDLNPHYVAEVGARFGSRFKDLELIVGDIQTHEVSFVPRRPSVRWSRLRICQCRNSHCENIFHAYRRRQVGYCPPVA